jgi:hypothetical protein
MPNEWYHTLQAQISIKSVVNFQNDKFIVNGKCVDRHNCPTHIFIMNIY